MKKQDQWSTSSSKSIVREKTATVIHRGTLRDLVLRVLIEGPAHGYDIMKRVTDMTRGEWKPSAGTLYPLLNQLVEEGYIEIAEIDNSRVRGGRRIRYRLTEKGWHYIARKLYKTAENGLRILKAFVVDAISFLRDHGMVEEADAICESVCQGLREILDSLEGECESACTLKPA